MKQIKIGNVALGGAPVIVVPLTDITVKTVSEIKTASVVELRIDMFSDFSMNCVSAVFNETKMKFNLPVIATCRAFEEGGAVEINDGKRIDLLTAAAQCADAIDIELNSRIFGDIMKIAKSKEIPLIASFHDFKKTPPQDELEHILEKSKQAGADITKIALMANTMEDVGLLAGFTLRHRDAAIVCISMGSVGMASRVFFPLIGSLFTFATIETTTAPGQLSVDEMAKFYDF
ncbi:MAG: type I 3-dehydroquinate dehydratase [Nitrospirae bacterium YQR-1]